MTRLVKRVVFRETWLPKSLPDFKQWLQDRENELPADGVDPTIEFYVFEEDNGPEVEVEIYVTAPENDSERWHRERIEKQTRDWELQRLETLQAKYGVKDE